MIVKMEIIDKGSINYRGELLRKAIHLCSLSIPIIYYFLTKEMALQILIPLTLFALIIDFGRYFFGALDKLVKNIFGFILREHETDNRKKNLNGATYVLIAASITLLIFPKIIFITAFSMLIICDISAALIGRRFGKHKFLSKSLEGTLAFFIAGFLVALFTPKIDNLLMEYIIAIFASAIGAIVENISYGWADDNLTIPLSVGFVMWGLYLLFLPHLNLYTLV